MDLAGVTPIALDITDPASVAAPAQAASGVAILVNNAGSSTGSSLLIGDLAAIRLEMDTRCVSRRLSGTELPILARYGAR